MRWLLAIALVAAPLAAQAAANDDCAKAYERAQESRLDGRLRAAQEDLLSCAQTACPAFIRNDCGKWLDEVQVQQPSVVFVARRNGGDVADVSVTCNNQLLTDHLDGRPMPLDPGQQICRFEAAGAVPAVLELLIVEGQKGRLVEVNLAAVAPPPAPRPAPPPPPPPSSWRGPTKVVLASVAVLGVGGFVGLATSGLSAEHHLRDTCAPACADSEVQSVRTRYTLADISLGVGLASAAVAGYLFLSDGPERRVAVAVDGRGAAILVGSRF
jgi:hypothetical protein